MKNVLKDFVHQLDTMNTISGGVAATTVKIDTNQDNFTIQVKAPSLSSDSFNIFVRGNYLYIYSVLNDAELYEEHSDEAKEAARHMVPLFNRIFEIPPMVDVEQIDAVFEHGKLNIVMPFHDGQDDMQVKRIEIREF